MKLGILLLVLAAMMSCALPCAAQGTAFTYQGKLNNSGSPANGSYDLSFTVFDASTNGNQVGQPLTNLATVVNQGLFTVTLDFGGVFNGSNYWLEIAARTNGFSTFTPLSPRQKITPVPYAITAGNVSGAVALTQLPPSLVTNGASGVNVSGSFYGNGAGLTNVPGTLTSSQSNSLINVVTNGQFNLVYVPPNGANDMTATLNRYLMTPFTKVELAAGATYYCTNLTMGNNVYFDLNYAVIVMASNASGYLLDTGLTNNANQTIVHGVFDGQNESHYESTAVIPLPVTQPETYPSTNGSSVGNRSGIHLNLGAGGSFSDNQIRGFNRTGVEAFNYYSTGGVTNTYFSHNTAIMDFIGFVFNCGFDEPGGQYLAETAVMDDCAAYFCGIGCLAGAGNDRVQGCTLNENFIGFSQSAGINGEHGILSHSTLNHDSYGVYGYQITGGELIEGCVLYDNGEPFLFNACSGGVFIVGCNGELAVVATNGTTLTFDNNTGPYLSITNAVTADATSAVYFNNNRWDSHTDLTAFYGAGVVSNNVAIFAGFGGNGSALTNLNTYYPSNNWNLAAFTNGMANFSYKTGSSNGQAFISLYLSNGIPYIQRLQ